MLHYIKNYNQFFWSLLKIKDCYEGSLSESVCEKKM